MIPMSRSKTKLPTETPTMTATFGRLGGVVVGAVDEEGEGSFDKALGVIVVTTLLVAIRPDEVLVTAPSVFCPRFPRYVGLGYPS
jgi:hypothetical protein